MQAVDWLYLLLPYQFSPVIAGTAVVVLTVYFRGARAAAERQLQVGFGRHLAFFAGVALCYLVLHTRFDYYAQYMFFMHRLQHLVLHHIGAFLIALSAPWSVLALGLPVGIRERLLRPLVRNRLVRGLYRALQHPAVAPTLFVGLIFFWLIPEVHFDAMLNLKLYHLMNASMLIDGILFWWLMLNPSVQHASVRIGYGLRILIMVLITVPQVVLGAYIALSRQELFEIYAICGRAWPISPEVDQQLGGILTWIPAAMMSVLGVLLVLRMLLRAEQTRSEAPNPSADIA
uniref:cytochrome c oxidase assembly protein n=1 Tax=Marinobacterium profundum TaxID=1714300 RepID=UPI0008324A28|nr:cytochrome c oxidase assembly protein [Marinobacterium profundum]